MKTVILAGGQGTRLREETSFLPKPMIKIGDKPILWHIMSIYANQGFNDFIICSGYKNEVIKNYFLNYKSLENDFTVNLKSGNITIYNGDKNLDWNVTVVNTGEDTQTGGRIKRIKDFIEGERFFATYGDGLANINLSNLLQSHGFNKHDSGCLATLTAALNTSKFGEIEWELINLDSDYSGRITSFEEKSKTNWINGGFFVFEKEVFDYIKGDNEPLEGGLLTTLTKLGLLGVYKHFGFWQCMDTYKEILLLNKLYSNNDIKWEQI